MNITRFRRFRRQTIDAINVIGQWLAQDDFSGEVPYQAGCGDPLQAMRLCRL